MRKGFLINKELIINGGKFSEEYFEEFVDVIHEKFRTVPEKIFKSDYNRFDEETKKFLV